jgi:protein-S-isoprenylcysteine O-methyltransferase Ste14
MTARTRSAVAVAVVAVQAALLVALFAAPGGGDWPTPLWLARFASAVEVAGWAVLLVALVNLGRSLTPLPIPREHATLKTNGLYRLVRHPVYSGVLAIAFGAATASGSLVKLGLALALLALFTGKARWEEELLHERYAGYADYAARTPRFLPRPRRPPVLPPSDE